LADGPSGAPMTEDDPIRERDYPVFMKARVKRAEAGKRVLERLWVAAGFGLDMEQRFRWLGYPGEILGTRIRNPESDAWETQRIPVYVVEALGAAEFARETSGP